ncbi:MAG: hypothetical protein HKN05_04355, partial [Rhizobiales bacterium]|nr:hypothetical protein [Hyphomicrobiales bacterium]
MAQALVDRKVSISSVQGMSLSCLERALKTGSEPERCLAAKALGCHPNARAASVLVSALRDQDPDVRCEVAFSLAKVGDAQAISPLLENLRDDPVGEVKSVYLQVLKSLGFEVGLDLVCALATGRAEELDVQWEDDLSGWDDWLDVQLAAIEALGAQTGGSGQQSAVQAILAALQDPDGQDLWAPACQSLARMGGVGIGALERLQAVASPLNKKRIATSLLHAESLLAEPLLCQLVRDKDVSVRLAALDAATKIGLESVCESATKDVAPEVRAAAYDGLNGPSPRTLATGLNDINPKVRMATCRAIERAGQEVNGLSVANRVEQLLRTGDPALLAAMVSACAVSEPGKTVELVEDMVNNPSTATPVRLVCVRLLGTLCTPRSVELLISAANDKRQDIRLACLVALGKCAKAGGARAQKAAQALMAALEGTLIATPAGWMPEEPAVPVHMPRKNKQAPREGAEGHVQLDGNGNIVEKAAEVLVDPTTGAEDTDPVPISTLDAILAPGVSRDEATEAAGIVIDEEDLPYLARTAAQISKRRLSPEATTPAHLDVPRLAARILATLPREEFVAPLAAASQSQDKELAISALDALNALADLNLRLDDAEQHLLHSSQAEDAELRARSVQALRKVATMEALEALKGALADDNGGVRAAALQGLSDLEATDIPYAEFCKDTDRRVRRAAAQQLARQNAETALPILLDYATIEDAVQSRDAACLMSDYGQPGFSIMEQLVQCDDPKSRLTGLSML